MISELNDWPACALVNASPAVLPWPAHDSGPGRVASPFPYGSFIRYSPPPLTGAFPDPFTRPPTSGSKTTRRRSASTVSKSGVTKRSVSNSRPPVAAWPLVASGSLVPVLAVRRQMVLLYGYVGGTVKQGQGSHAAIIGRRPQSPRPPLPDACCHWANCVSPTREPSWQRARGPGRLACPYVPRRACSAAMTAR
jgi:hypothetical protein